MKQSDVPMSDGKSAGKVRNILFIMCDQLRRDYLGCYGHKTIRTPNIDALAQSGTLFTRCYVQGPVCGPSRMSTYTGRYVSSHGATWNFVPVGVQTPTMGEYMRKAGLRTAVVGKTHAVGDVPGMKRLGIDPDSDLGRQLSQGGFEPYARHDGIITDAALSKKSFPYNDYLHKVGYASTNAWHDFANSAIDHLSGALLSGWRLRNSRHQARVEEKHSETAWTTDTAMDFIREQGDSPWCLHLSYIKPHWPYIAPAPYHEKYSEADIQAPARSDAEKTDIHPVYRAFRNHPESLSFASDGVRSTVIPTYMGLIEQVDDHLGRLVKFLKDTERFEDTLIVFTSDHGDLLGDHWLGEKEMFYEGSAGVPLIVVDPDATAKGQINSSLVEAIDLIPTFLDALGQPVDERWLEGRSLLAQTRFRDVEKREAAFSELDYAFYPARKELGLAANEARAEMVCTERWKYIHYQGFPPQLFDLVEDPSEVVDLGTDPGMAEIRKELLGLLITWRATLRNRATMSDSEVDAWLEHRSAPGGIEIGVW